MPFRWHVNLPGPVAYSRPIRRKGKKPGPLTSVLVWFIVKPFELMFLGLAKLFRTRVDLARHAQTHANMGWYNTQYGPLWFNGRVWVRPDGRPF